MSFTFDVKKEKDYIRVTVSGERNFNNVKQIVAEIVDASTQHKVSRAIVDISQLKGSIEMIEAYELATKVLSNFRGQWLQRAAVVDLPERRDRYEFFENVAVNRGYYIRIFNDCKTAKKWLCD